MNARNRAAAATAVGFVVVAALVLWTPLDTYTSLVLVFGPGTLVVVPRDSIVDGLRIVSRRTGVGWGWWLLALLAFVAFVRVTQRLGAPDALVRCSSTIRPILCPTGYGIGTALVLLGGCVLVVTAGRARTYLAFSRSPPAHDRDPSGERATLEGRFDPEGSALETPIEGAQAIWYAYEIAERPSDGLFRGYWLPIGGGDRSTPCRTSGPRGSRLPVDLGSPRLVPTFVDANVHYAERIVRSDESPPPGIARLERERTDGDPSAERTGARRYREWYVTPDDVAVVNGPLASGRFDVGRGLGGDDARTLLGVGTTYPALCASLRASTLLWGSGGLALTGAGLAIVMLTL